MATCVNCGKKGFFLKVNEFSVCRGCELDLKEKKRQEEIERERQKKIDEENRKIEEQREKDLELQACIKALQSTEAQNILKNGFNSEYNDKAFEWFKKKQGKKIRFIHFDNENRTNSIQKELIINEPRHYLVAQKKHRSSRYIFYLDYPIRLPKSGDQKIGRLNEHSYYFWDISENELIYRIGLKYIYGRDGIEGLGYAENENDVQSAYSWKCTILAQ
jgi:hypothetical protein